jgi:hypothetical protein
MGEEVTLNGLVQICGWNNKVITSLVKLNT